MFASLSFRAALCFAFLLALAMAGHTAEEAVAPPQKVDQEIRVAVVPGQMKFDVDSFSAKPNTTVRITLTNKDVMQHNLVICRPGVDTGMKVAQSAWALGSQALAKQYIPDSPDVLFHTRLVDPSGEDSFVFKTPAKEGDYPYVCTMPGHAMTMKGIMRISHSAARKKPDVLNDITYRLYPGAQSLDAVGALSPHPAQKAGGFSLMPFKMQSRPYAVVFEGTLALAAPDKLTFELGSTDADLSVDGKTILAAKLTSNEARIDLGAGKHTVTLRYRCNEDDPWCELSVRPSKELIFAWLMAPLPKLMVLNPTTTPIIARVSLDGCSPDTVAVGLPGGSNYCFDPLQCAVRYGWTGRFLDAGPDFFNRGGKPCNILGQRFDLGPGTCPVRIGGNDNPVVRFLGYRMAADPQLLFSVDGQEVIQTVIPATSPDLVHGFTYRFEVPGVHEPVRFIAPPGVRANSKAGVLQNGVLALPADRAAGFDISVFPAK